jgi:cytidylate kinase
MSSVMISSRSFTPGAMIAAAVAAELELDVVDDSLYGLAADRFGVSVRDVRRAMERGPSLYGMSSSRRRRLALCLQAVLSSRLAEGDVVYHGPFAGQLLRGIAHLLKVRVTASVDDRARVSGRGKFSEAEAIRHVQTADRVQNEIARTLFGLDETDADYDLVVDLSEVETPAAVSAIAEAARAPACRPTTFSRHQLRDRRLADTLAATLACELRIEVEVRVHAGATEIRAQAPDRKRAKIRACAESHAAKLGGIDKIEVETVDCWLHPLPASLR